MDMSSFIFEGGGGERREDKSVRSRAIPSIRLAVALSDVELLSLVLRIASIGVSSSMVVSSS
jgi:hypothetical protein